MESYMEIEAEATANQDYQDEKGYCSVPEVPVRALERVTSPTHEELIRYIEKAWVNGTELRYYYFRSGPYAGPEDQIAVVEKGFEVWRNVGIGITFTEVEDISEAEIRIGFQPGGSWSYVGRDVIDVPGQRERTMNFGWDLLQDRRGVDVPVHEIGHTLGFPHEHQNPFSTLLWDEQAVLDYFAQTQGWAADRTRHNVLRKLSNGEVEGSRWDPDSVMHYSFAAGLILSPEKYRNGLSPKGGLSREDRRRALRFYPSLGKAKAPALKPFESHSLDLEPADQANFNITPRETREYTMGTFGQSDVVMILFEKQESGLRFLAGNDDSGTERNASIQARLLKGREYVLRVRMYLNYGSAKSAIMLW